MAIAMNRSSAYAKMVMWEKTAMLLKWSMVTGELGELGLIVPCLVAKMVSRLGAGFVTIQRPLVVAGIALMMAAVARRLGLARVNCHLANLVFYADFEPILTS